MIDLEIKTYKSLQIFSNNLLRVKYHKRTKSDSPYLFLTIASATRRSEFYTQAPLVCETFSNKEATTGVILFYSKKYRIKLDLIDSLVGVLFIHLVIEYYIHDPYIAKTKFIHILFLFSMFLG